MFSILSLVKNSYFCYLNIITYFLNTNCLKFKISNFLVYKIFFNMLICFLKVAFSLDICLEVKFLYVLICMCDLWMSIKKNGMYVLHSIQFFFKIYLYRYLYPAFHPVRGSHNVKHFTKGPFKMLVSVCILTLLAFSLSSLIYCGVL